MATVRSTRLAVALAVLAAACDHRADPPEDVSYATVSAGWLNHTCALATAGTAYCWGGNGSGQLGGGPDVPLAPRFAPSEVAGGHAFSIVSAGGMHACALDAAGRAYCWGSHRDGQLGIGSVEAPSRCRGAPCAASPATVAGGMEFTAISAGYGHTCAITPTGEIYCWGAAHMGQVGDGRAGPDASSPAPVRVESEIAFVAVSAGQRHSCALAEDGRAYCWGENFWAQAGPSADQRCVRADGTSAPCSTTPVPVAEEMAFETISAGEWHTCAATTDGTAYCWGAASSGRLGVEPDSVARECGGADQAIPCSPEPLPVSGGLRFRSVTAGGAHSCGLADDGRSYCWGGNLLGQLGDGSLAQRSATPRATFGEHAFTRLSAGGGHSCAIAEDEGAYCWGRNDSGQLGTPVGSAAHGPVRVDPPDG